MPEGGFDLLVLQSCKSSSFINELAADDFISKGGQLIVNRGFSTVRGEIGEFRDDLIEFAKGKRVGSDQGKYHNQWHIDPFVHTARFAMNNIFAWFSSDIDKGGVKLAND